jgi:hypothetical protein
MNKKIFTGTLLGKLRERCVDNINTDLREVFCEYYTCMEQVQDFVTYPSKPQW